MPKNPFELPDEGIRTATLAELDDLRNTVSIQREEIEALIREVESKVAKPGIRGGFNVDDVRSYGNIQAAVASVPSTQKKTLYVTDGQTIDAALNVPENIEIVVTSGYFTSSNGSRITFNGPATINGYAFRGDVRVSFAMGAVHYTRPEWFGADPFGVNDSTAAIQRCLDTILVSGIADAADLGSFAPDVLFVGKYKVLLPGVIMNRRCSLIGVDTRSSWIEYGSLTGACITLGCTVTGGTSITATGSAGANSVVVSNSAGIVDGSIIFFPSTQETYRAKSVAGTTVTLYNKLIRAYSTTTATKNVATLDHIGVDGYTSNITFRNLKIEGAVALGDPRSNSASYNSAYSVGVYSGAISHRLTFNNCIVQRFFKGITSTDAITQRMIDTTVRVCDKGLTFPYVAQTAANLMTNNTSIADNRVGIESLPTGSTTVGIVFEANTYAAMGAVLDETGTRINAMGDNCVLIGNWNEGTKDIIRGDFYNCVVVKSGVMSSGTASMFRDYTINLETRNTFIQPSPNGNDIDPVSLLPESRLGRIALKGGVGTQGSGGSSFAAYVDALALYSNTDLYAPRNVKQGRIRYFDKAPAITAGKAISGDVGIDVGGAGPYECLYPLLGYGCIGTPSQATDAFTGTSGNKFISVAYDGSGIEAEDSLLLTAAATTTATGTLNALTAVVASATNIIIGSRVKFSGTGETLTVENVVGTTVTFNKKLKQAYSGTTITIYHVAVVISDTAISTTLTGTVGTNSGTLGSATNIQVGYRIKVQGSNEQLTIRTLVGTAVTFDSNLGETYAGETIYVVPVKLYTTTATGTAGTNSLTLGSGVGVVAGDILKLPLEDIVVSAITGTAVTTSTNLVNNVSGGACSTTKVVIHSALSFSYTGLSQVLISDLCEWKLNIPIRDVDGSNRITGNTVIDGDAYVAADLVIGRAAANNPNGATRAITLQGPLTGAERVDLNMVGNQTADGLLLALQAMNGSTNMGYLGFARFGANNTSMAEIRVRAAGVDTPSFRYEPTRNISNTRLEHSKGADVVAANDLTLGTDGNKFIITGNTQINGIAIANWQAGSEIDLLFSGTPTVKHNTAASAGFAKLFLSASVDLVAAANTCLTLWYDGTQWQEKCRKVA